MSKNIIKYLLVQRFIKIEDYANGQYQSMNYEEMKETENKSFIKHPKFFFYVWAYVILFFMSSCSGLGYEGHTTSYPEPGDCMIISDEMYYFNAIAHSEYRCISEVIIIQWIFFILSLIMVVPLYFLRKEIWQGRRFGALPEWILITLCYWLFLMLLSPQSYPGLYERLITLSAVYEIFEPFLIWQLMVTVVFWGYKNCKIILKKLVVKN